MKLERASFFNLIGLYNVLIVQINTRKKKIWGTMIFLDQIKNFEYYFFAFKIICSRKQFNSVKFDAFERL